MNCKKCGAYIRRGEQICPSCGASLSDAIYKSTQEQNRDDPSPSSQQAASTYCRFCGEKNASNYQYCLRCGKPLVTPKIDKRLPKHPKKRKKIWLYIAIAEVVIIIAACVFIFMLISSSTSPSPQEPAQNVAQNDGFSSGPTSGTEGNLPSESAFTSEPTSESAATTGPAEVPSSAPASTEAVTTAPAPETDPQIVLTNADAKEIFREYFWANYPDAERVCLIDFTHDGIDEMLVIRSYIDETQIPRISAHVFTINDAWLVEQIYSCSGGLYTLAGPVFNLNIIPGQDGWLLGHEDGVWFTNSGDLTYSVFWLQPDGSINLVDEFVISSGDVMEEAEATGADYFELLDLRWDEYAEKRSYYLSDAIEPYDIYDTDSIPNGDILVVPEEVFG